MNRKEIESEYTVDSAGIIRNSGKFEAEPLYVPYFWDSVMNGFGDTQYDGDTPTDYFDVTEEDVREFPELQGVTRIAVWESDSGFVNSALDPEDLPESEEEDSELYA